MVAALMAAVLFGCSSSETGGGQSLVGNWIDESSDKQSGVAFTFKSDDTYVGSEIVLTSDSSANAEVEVGTFTTSGGKLTLTPTEWTCPGPDTLGAYSYSFAGANLVLTTATGTLTLQPNPSTGSSAPSESIAEGCFDSEGAFTPMPLAPVAN